MLRVSELLSLLILPSWPTSSKLEGRSLVPCPHGCRCAGPNREFGECKLTVSCEKLAAFPRASEYPASSDCIFLSGARLAKLSAEAKETGLRAIPASVRRLDLAGCGLGELPSGDALGRLVELRVLNLEFNRLRTLPRSVFHGVSKLKVLWLTGNHYQPEEREYKRMKALGNRIQLVNDDQFQGLVNLQVLLLHHNHLSNLPENLFAYQHRLKVLKLVDNPFKPALTRNHPVFASLLKKELPVLYQLDLQRDTGDELEDYWEQTGTYLSDAFSPGPPPRGQMHRDEF